jgi:hypothetical protein
MKQAHSVGPRGRKGTHPTALRRADGADGGGERGLHQRPAPAERPPHEQVRAEEADRRVEDPDALQQIL